MKVEKNKIVFAAVLVVIFIFLISYSMMVMGDDESENENLEQTLIPDLEENQKEYDSKLDAINDLKEVRENNAPSIYDEKLIGFNLGFYDPDLPRTVKKNASWIAFTNAGKIQYSEKKISKLWTKESRSKEHMQQIDSTEHQERTKN